MSYRIYIKKSRKIGAKIIGNCAMADYIAPGTKRIDACFSFIMVYYAGEWTYKHSAPCLHLNPAMLEYWMNKAEKES